jgi:hypothetical protein
MRNEMDTVNEMAQDASSVAFTLSTAGGISPEIIYQQAIGPKLLLRLTHATSLAG